MTDDAKITKGLACLVKIQKFVRDNEIRSSETVYQSDRVIVNAYDFIAELCDIVGFHEDEE